MTPFNLLTATRHGFMVCNHHDAYVGQSLLAYGEYSELEMAFLAGYLRPGDVVLEVGANIGALTVPLAQHVGPRGCVVAFEPQRLCYQALCANVALNSLTNVLTFQSAVGAAHGTLRTPLLDPRTANNFGGVSLSPAANGETVPVAPIDAMGLPRARLLKADVEGMEADMLRGARAYLAQHRPVLYVEADREEKRAELLALLDALGYDAWDHTPPLYSPDNWRRNPENAWPDVVSINLLALPRGGKDPAPDLEVAC